MPGMTAEKSGKRRSARRESPSPATHEFAIVGVGASAGGFEAFVELLEALPPEPQLAIIFVQHLSPNHSSALPSLLAPRTSLEVIEATEGVRIAVNRLYVVPPNAQMELVDGHLHVGRRPDDRTQYTPIDVFFSSLAGTLKGQAIGVILSGTASDGAAGIREIKAVGGIAIAQEPTTAKYDGMPRAAIATQVVDLVLDPRNIAAKLSEIAADPEAVSAGIRKQAPPEVPEQQLDRIFNLLLPACGVDFVDYKTPTIVRRLLRRMSLLRIATVDDYIAHLERTPAEVVKLHDDLLIHVTRFFREPESFDALARKVLPTIDLKPDVPLRAWVAGCATGEEAYSLAIVFHEALSGRMKGGPIQIFGTDVSENAIEYARRGLYPDSIATDVSPERLQRFFVKSDGGYRVTTALRDMCVFARQDLTRDPPFSRLDLISCRNVLIYMDARLQKKLLATFHYALKPSGVLLLGHAESIGYKSDQFAIMDKKHRMFRKKPGVTPNVSDFSVVKQSRSDGVTQRSPGRPSTTRVVMAEATRLVLDRFAPPSVLVDERLEIVQFNGHTGPFFEASPGEPTFHVLRLAREGLLHDLRAALQTAQKTRRIARRSGLRVRSGTTWQHVDLEVVPFVQQNQPYYLVLFDTRPNGKKKKEAQRAIAPPRATGANVARVAKLEEELAATREYLQSMIQEIEATNEQLQSANEEILSSNEELQSTNEELDTAKEELQSTNEELNTVNDELHARNDELTRVNTDLMNLLASVQIAIVIVSRDLRIRRFTPMAERMFNLISSDVGRPLSQISPNIDSPDLLTVIAESIDNVTPVERNVKDKEGHTYLMRVRPSKSSDNRIDGAIVALLDLELTRK